MKLKDCKPGQWISLAGSSPVLVCVQSSNVTLLAYSNPPYVQWHGMQEECEVLEGCTGYDWTPPKPGPTYRPFANAFEFWPHCDRWWRFKYEPEDIARRTCVYGGEFHELHDWQESLEKKIFCDGSPFGVEVVK